MSSLLVYNVSSYFSTIGFVYTVVLNSILIFLTLLHIHRIDNTYKVLIIIFAALCLVFSCIEMLVHPFYHSYNGGLINFNMVKWNGWSQRFITLMVASYSGVYVTIVSFFTVLFVFRYWTMLRSPFIHFLKSWKLIFPVLCALFFGFLCGIIVLFFGEIDDCSKDYLRDVMMKNYNLDVEKMSGYVVIAYNQNGSLRWNSFFFSFGIICLLGFQFIIVGYCGFKMHFNMHEMLKNVSDYHKRLQHQFFKSLVIQITSPTLTFYIPAVTILTLPFLNLTLSLPTGFIVCSFSIYPPIDSAILMCIVADYRKIIKHILLHPTTIFSKKAFKLDTNSTSTKPVFLPRQAARLNNLNFM